MSQQIFPFITSQGNPTIFIESTIHAREWITAATATYFLNELLTSRDAQIKAMAKNFDWVFVPIVNVDGYEYSHKKVGNWIYDIWRSISFDLFWNWRTFFGPHVESIVEEKP